MRILYVEQRINIVVCLSLHGLPKIRLPHANRNLVALARSPSPVMNHYTETRLPATLFQIENPHCRR